MGIVSLDIPFFLYGCANSVYAVVEENILSQKILDLRMKSHAHGKFVSELLGNPVDSSQLKLVLIHPPPLCFLRLVWINLYYPPESLSQPPLSLAPDLPDVEERFVQIHCLVQLTIGVPVPLPQEVVFINLLRIRKLQTLTMSFINPRFLNEEWGIILAHLRDWFFLMMVRLDTPRNLFSLMVVSGGLRLGHDFGVSGWRENTPF